VRLCTGRTTHRGSRYIVLLFCTTALEGDGSQCQAPVAFDPRKDRVFIVQEAGWVLGPVWKGAENLAPTGIRSLDRRARSQSLYRLSYPGPLYLLCLLQIEASLSTRTDVRHLLEDKSWPKLDDEDGGGLTEGSLAVYRGHPQNTRHSFEVMPNLLTSMQITLD
jgi:hypothetical protein